MRLTPEQLAEVRRATQRAHAAIKPGDVIVRAVCMDGLEPFYFRAWEGSRLCGNHSPDAKRPRRGQGWDVCDCAAIDVRSVNGHAIDLSDMGGPVPDRQTLARPNLSPTALSRPRAP